MATLYDLAMQYLNQSLPKTFKYDRTNPPTIGPIIRPIPGPETNPEKLLPVQGGGGGGGSNNPYDLSTDFSQITSDRQKRLSQDPTGLNKFLIDTLGMQKPQTAEDIVNLGYRTPSKFGIGALLPDKYGELPRADQAFIASRMGYTGPTVFGENTSGLSKDPFGLNTRSAFGNYAERVGVEAENLGKSLEKSAAKKGLSFDPATGKVTGGTPAEIAAWEKQTSMLNTKFDFYTKENEEYKDYQNQVQNVLDADKEFSTEGDSSNYGIDGYPTYDIKDIQGEDDEEFDPTSLDFTNPNIYNANSIYTQTAPTYITDPYVSGQDDKDIGTTPPGTSDDGYVTDYYGGDPVTDAGGTAPGGGYATDYYGGDSVTDAGGTAPGGGYATDYYGGGDQNTGVSVGPDNEPNPGDTDTFNTETGNENDSGSNTGTHCCTAANERGDMTLTEVKKLRAWHRKQSKIWQRGYDVWGKVIADNLVAKSKWQSNRVRDFYNHKIYKKRTIGSIYADIVIYPMSMIIGSILTVMPPILGYQENKRHGKSSS